MATHSSVLAWRIPGKGEPGGLLSMGSLPPAMRETWIRPLGWDQTQELRTGEARPWSPATVLHPLSHSKAFM